MKMRYKKMYSEEFIEQMWVDIEMLNRLKIPYRLSRNRTGVVILTICNCNRRKRKKGRKISPEHRKWQEEQRGGPKGKPTTDYTKPKGEGGTQDVERNIKLG